MRSSWESFSSKNHKRWRAGKNRNYEARIISSTKARTTYHRCSKGDKKVNYCNMRMLMRQVRLPPLQVSTSICHQIIKSSPMDDLASFSSWNPISWTKSRRVDTIIVVIWAVSPWSHKRQARYSRIVKTYQSFSRKTPSLNLRNASWVEARSIVFAPASTPTKWSARENLSSSLRCEARSSIQESLQAWPQLQDLGVIGKASQQHRRCMGNHPKFSVRRADKDRIPSETKLSTTPKCSNWVTTYRTM